MRIRDSRGLARLRTARTAIYFAALFAMVTAARLAIGTAEAAPKLRFQIDQHGDMKLFGNTVGFDCRAGIPAPTAGDVDMSACGGFLTDSSADVWWRSDEPASGRATASISIDKDSARSTAMLDLPADAQVTYARLYVSATYDEAAQPKGIVQFDRDGKFMQTLTAQGSDIERNIVGGATYQASFDVTALLQKHGSGLYRVTGVPGLSATNVNSDVNYAAWAVVVFYRRDADPVRNLTLFDGLTGVGGGQEAKLDIAGFAVPASGTPDAKLGVIAYEGDHDKTMDSLLWNNQKLSDGTTGSEDNFFNSSRMNKGQPESLGGDLPRLSGAPASMIGLDLDIVDVSAFVKPGDGMAAVAVRSLADDVVFVGALVTSITSTKPIIETTLSAQPAGKARPGDPIEFTSTSKNVGNESGTDVVVRHILPPELDYVPGTCQITAGPGLGAKSDALGDDECEVVDTTDPQSGRPTRQLIVRIGNGATALTGGSIAPTDPAIVVKYRARVKDDAPPGDLPARSTTSVTPPSGGMTALFPSCAPTPPCAATIITVPPCASAIDCGVNKPICDTTGVTIKGQCTDRCKVSADCKGSLSGEVCDFSTGKCLQCSTSATDACTADGLGKLCRADARCGCNSDADCGGRSCSANRCPLADSDLVVELTQTPDPAASDTPVKYLVTVTNRGPARDPGPVRVAFEIPQTSGGYIESVEPGPEWRCTVMSRTVECIHPSPLDVNAPNPAVTVTVRPYDPANSADPNHPANPQRRDPPTVQVMVTVQSDGSQDKNPADNTVYLLTPFGDGLYRIAGGGASCAMGYAPSHSSAWALLATLLSLGSLASRVRRRRGRSA